MAREDNNNQYNGYVLYSVRSTWVYASFCLNQYGYTWCIRASALGKSSARSCAVFACRLRVFWCSFTVPWIGLFCSGPVKWSCVQYYVPDPEAVRYVDWSDPAIHITGNLTVIRPKGPPSGPHFNKNSPISKTTIYSVYYPSIRGRQQIISARVSKRYHMLNGYMTIYSPHGQRFTLNHGN